MISLKSNLKVISNNVSACELINKNIKFVLIDGGYLDVLYAVRDCIHRGNVLVTHPMMGSVKPNETPYRSIILEEKEGPLDYQSLSVIESSMERCKKFLKDRPTPEWSDKVLEDFSFLDMKLLESALSSLGIIF